MRWDAVMHPSFLHRLIKPHDVLLRSWVITSTNSETHYFEESRKKVFHLRTFERRNDFSYNIPEPLLVFYQQEMINLWTGCEKVNQISFSDINMAGLN